MAAEDAAVAAEDAEDKGTSMRRKQMKTKTNIMTSPKISAGRFCDPYFLFVRRWQCTLRHRPKRMQPATAQPAQKQFDTPKQAADALIQVAATFDVAAAKEILGPDGEDLIASEDPVQDKNRAAEFAAKAKEKNLG